MTQSRNFTDQEKSDLVDLVAERAHEVENKTTDSGANKEKSLAWYKLSVKFNENKIQMRTDEQLKTCWKTLKATARKYAGELRNDRYKVTGGGEREVAENPLLEKVLRIITISGKGLHNPMDGDTFSQNVEEILLDPKKNSTDTDVWEYLQVSGAIPSWASHTPAKLKTKLSPQLTRGAQILIKNNSPKIDAKSSTNERIVLKMVSNNNAANSPQKLDLHELRARDFENKQPGLNNRKVDELKVNDTLKVETIDPMELDMDLVSLLKEEARLKIQLLREKLQNEKMRKELLRSQNAVSRVTLTNALAQSLGDSTEQDV